MKHTFIFIVNKNVTEGDLYRLALAAHHFTISYKTEREDCCYTRVQFFTDDNIMHLIARRAGFSEEQLRLVIPVAKRRGARAVEKASDALRNLKLDAIDRKRATQMPGGTKRSKRSC